jgi:hypothetical protein
MSRGISFWPLIIALLVGGLAAPETARSEEKTEAVKAAYILPDLRLGDFQRGGVSRPLTTCSTGSEPS